MDPVEDLNYATDSFATLTIMTDDKDLCELLGHHNLLALKGQWVFRFGASDIAARVSEQYMIEPILEYKEAMAIARRAAVRIGLNHLYVDPQSKVERI